MFLNETRHEPNMIVFASALWDIARCARHLHPGWNGAFLHGAQPVTTVAAVWSLCNMSSIARLARDMLAVLDGRSLQSILHEHHRELCGVSSASNYLSCSCKRVVACAQRACLAGQLELTSPGLVCRLIEHFPDVLKDRDDVPEPELSQFINGTADVLRMIEVRVFAWQGCVAGQNTRTGVSRRNGLSWYLEQLRSTSPWALRECWRSQRESMARECKAGALRPLLHGSFCLVSIYCSLQTPPQRQTAPLTQSSHKNTSTPRMQCTDDGMS